MIPPGPALPVLFTARLQIEPLEAAHAELLVEPLQHPDIYRFIPISPLSLAALQRRYAFLEGRKSPDGREHWLNWVLFQKEDRVPVGTFEATIREQGHADIAYILFPRYWKQGFASEAAPAIFEQLRTRFAVPRVGADIDTRNAASLSLVERLGFHRVKLTPNADFFRGQRSDEVRYELLL